MEATGAGQSGCITEKMKLSVLLLPALLALSSASLQDIVKKSAQHRKVPFLNPGSREQDPSNPCQWVSVASSDSC
ncbi:uncharacterized protein LOC117253120 isoform X2 [Epinephelus lanceolatus]